MAETRTEFEEASNALSRVPSVCPRVKTEKGLTDLARRCGDGERIGCEKEGEAGDPDFS